MTVQFNYNLCWGKMDKLVGSMSDAELQDLMKV
jgi:hypothetical protein